jgi:hypothetical protein
LYLLSTFAQLLFNDIQIKGKLCTNIVFHKYIFFEFRYPSSDLHILFVYLHIFTYIYIYLHINTYKKHFTMDINKIAAVRIKELRISLGISAKSVASDLDIAISNYSKLEN